MSKDRMIWLDVARGGTILMVVAVHAVYAAQVIGPLPREIYKVINVLGFVRMPLFFFCSGLLAAKAMRRPWHQMIEGRVLVISWVYVIWSLLYAVFDRIYDVVPRAPGRFAGMDYFLIAHEGVLWFIYALIVVTLIARILISQPWLIQIAATVILAMTFGALENHVVMMGGSSWLLRNLATYALASFMAGVWTADLAIWIMSRPALARRLFLASIVGAAVSGSLHYLGMGLAHVMVTAFGVTAGIALSAEIAKAPQIARPLAWIGRNTLEIFLIHQLIIGLLTLICYHAGIRALPASGIALAGAVAGGALFAAVARPLGLGILFMPPRALRSGISTLGALAIERSPGNLVESMRSRITDRRGA